MTLSQLIFAGGVLHFGILIASALVPQVLDWRNELAKLQRLTRELVWVHGAFIVLIIISFGVLSILMAGELASGTALARSICAMVAVFWLARVSLQFVLFKPQALLTKWYLKAGYHGLTIVFFILVGVYGVAAIAPQLF